MQLSSILNATATLPPPAAKAPAQGQGPLAPPPAVGAKASQSSEIDVNSLLSELGVDESQLRPSQNGAALPRIISSISLLSYILCTHGFFISLFSFLFLFIYSFIHLFICPFIHLFILLFFKAPSAPQSSGLSSVYQQALIDQGIVLPFR